MNLYIVYELKLWLYPQTNDFSVTNSLLGAVQLTKDADSDKYSYFGYGSGFDVCQSFSLSDSGGFGKNVTIFGVDNSS